jgi:hypothetical protein
VDVQGNTVSRAHRGAMALQFGIVSICMAAVRAGSPWAGTDVVTRAADIVAKVTHACMLDRLITSCVQSACALHPTACPTAACKAHPHRTAQMYIEK